MRDLEGKRVLITGSARGIGLEMAIQFAEAGATIVLGDRDADALVEAEEMVRAVDSAVHSYAFDVTALDEIAALPGRIAADVGPIDILVNNAGVVFGGEFHKVPLDQHLLTYRVNVEGVVAVTHAFLPGLLKRDKAHIVNVASASAFVGLPYGSTYASSKWAVLGFSESMRAEFKETGQDHVHVTAVCPSYIGTGMFDGVKTPDATKLLTPEFVARKVVDAVRHDHPYVLEPWLVKMTPPLKGLLPTAVWDRLGRALGVTKSMATWKGRDAGNGEEQDAPEAGSEEVGAESAAAGTEQKRVSGGGTEG